MTNYDPLGRPTPLREAFRTVGGVISIVGSLVVFGASWGLLSTDQVSALDAALAAVPGLVALGTGLAAAFGVVARGEPEVTPVDSPRSREGTPLVPAQPTP